MSVGVIYHFIRFDDRLATAGQPTAAQFREARDAGYEVEINLAPDALETSLPDEAGLVAYFGLEYHHLSVTWAQPRLDQRDRFDALMVTADGRKTWATARRTIASPCSTRFMPALGWHGATSRGMP
jgi:protein tyrosine phosphatase (PTP) superfamily phosphohydrolase (DUF442 family)